MKKILIPPGLQPGATIAIVAPAAPCEAELEGATAVLEQAGYRVRLGKSVGPVTGYLAGEDQLRAADLMDQFKDDSVQAILCLRGGYGCGRLLPLLDFAEIRRHPKLFIGYSDITALHLALQERAALATVHGPMLCNLLPDRRPTKYTTSALLTGLQKPFASGQFQQARGHRLRWLYPPGDKPVSGRIMGGNLTVLASLVGTPYQLQGDGAILFLEDVGEAAYRLDRMLNQLTQSGLIDRVQAVVFGDFTDCQPTKPEPGDYSVPEVLEHYAQRWQKPCLAGLSAGHGRQNGWLPLGVMATLTENKILYA